MAISRRKVLEPFFPKLAEALFQITSPPTANYNCIAWAAEDSEVWWEPDPAFIYYWPPGVPREYTVQCYIEAYGTVGYRTPSVDSFEEGVDKVAIFARDGRPLHAARQLSDGQWTSKCGQFEDISHPLHSLEGELYGTVEVILARNVTND